MDGQARDRGCGDVDGGVVIGARVTTPDGPGTLVRHRRDGTVDVRLDGEDRIDNWHPSQVRPRNRAHPKPEKETP